MPIGVEPTSLLFLQNSQTAPYFPPMSMSFLVSDMHNLDIRVCILHRAPLPNSFQNRYYIPKLSLACAQIWYWDNLCWEVNENHVSRIFGATQLVNHHSQQHYAAQSNHCGSCTSNTRLCRRMENKVRNGSFLSASTITTHFRVVTIKMRM